MPRSLSAFLLLCASACAHSQTAAPVQHPAFPTDGPLAATIHTILADPAVSRAHWGIAVTTLDGTPLFGLNEGQFFRPASNNKLFTTAAAMSLLGPDATVTTRVTTVGTIDSTGSLDSDILLEGAGDANLSGRPIPYIAPGTPAAKALPHDPLGPLDDLAAQVAAKGVKRVAGRVFADERRWPNDPYGAGWSLDDEVWGYAAPVTPLVVDDNQLSVTVTASSTSVDPTVKVVPDIGFPHFNALDVKVLPEKSGASLGVDRDQPEDTIYLTGSIAAGSPDTENVALLNPAKFAAMAFKNRLEAHGIQIVRDAEPMDAQNLAPDFSWSQSRKPLTLPPTEAAAHAIARQTEAPHAGCGFHCTVLASRSSAPLADDVTVTLKVSQNLHAEMMLRRLGAAFAGDATFTGGARVVRQWLINAGLDPDDFAFTDGSGLSDKDIVTPRAVAQLLSFATQQSWFVQWKTALPVAGIDGSLASRFKDSPLKGKLFAKTGTLGESRALSGYLEAASGKTIIFSILVDTHAPASSADRIAMDRIVEAIAAAN